MQAVSNSQGPVEILFVIIELSKVLAKISIRKGIQPNILDRIKDCSNILTNKVMEYGICKNNKLVPKLSFVSNYLLVVTWPAQSSNSKFLNFVFVGLLKRNRLYQREVSDTLD